ncbi:MAG TPA: hypothetical protein VFW07_03575 [Parafilimonas sp.]|nr:hypothetical protein [Parafilimonas sp.]
MVGVTIIILTNSSQKPASGVPVGSGGSPDKREQVEKAKKNSIMRRFISYYQVSAGY